MHFAAHGMPPHSRQATCGMRRNWVMASASTYTIHTWRRGILHTVNGRQCVTMSLGILWKNATIKTLDCARTASCDASKCIWAMSWFHPPPFRPFVRFAAAFCGCLSCLARCHFDVHATIYGAVNNMATCFLLDCVWTC